MDFSPQILQGVFSFVLLGALLLAIGAYFAFRRSEFWATYKVQFALLESVAKHVVVQVSDMVLAGADMAVYEAKATLWRETKGVDLDPRMWAALDKIEPIFKNFFEFDLIVSVLESTYQRERKDPRNGLVLNAKDVTDAVNGSGATATLEVSVDNVKVGLTPEQAAYYNAE
jgi:hypothetical protein